jgi:hypothetical protein
VAAYKNYPAALSAFVSDLRLSGLTLGDFVSRIHNKGLPPPYLQEHFKPDFNYENHHLPAADSYSLAG